MEEGLPKGELDDIEVIMPVRVTINAVEIRIAENPRFPGEGSSSQGQSVPKPRPKGVGNGKLVKHSSTSC